MARRRCALGFVRRLCMVYLEILGHGVAATPGYTAGGGIGQWCCSASTSMHLNMELKLYHQCRHKPSNTSKEWFCMLFDVHMFTAISIMKA